MNLAASEAKDQAVELLAPAGDWDCARAAIENGADAIYFGLDCGFNARYRAKNFGLGDLDELARTLRSRGVRGYVTMNTLVFPSEMRALVDAIERIAESGIDGVLVQDFGVAKLVREICPQLEVHASTQMSLTSAETIAVASQLGLSRVVLARELSLMEIEKIAAETTMPLEVFIHGALCVAYSGQCLTSESLGGRSANRGQCAQACRLPYELVCDGEDVDLEDVRYLLSPQDLAGYAAIPDLIAAGICSVKIEGRLKTPEYVANITGHYRRAIDDALRGDDVQMSADDQREMELSFSRGFSPGWLEGNDHKRLVPGLTSAKRGVAVGSISKVGRNRVHVLTQVPLACGDGLAIHGAEDPQGGRIYDLQDASGRAVKQIDAGEMVSIGFGRNEIEFDAIEPNDLIFKNDDPRLNRRLRKSFQDRDPQVRQSIDVRVDALVGKPLRIEARLTSPVGTSISVQVESDAPLEVARKHPASRELLSEKIGRLGGTPFQLGSLEANLLGDPMVPMATLNAVRRQMVDELLAQLKTPPKRYVDAAKGVRVLEQSKVKDAAHSSEPKLAVLCRTLEQLAASCESGFADLVYADFHDVREYRQAVQTAREHSVPIALANVRMQKPGEMGLLRALVKHSPDFVLARNLAAIDFAKQHSIPFFADFSLNVCNHVAADWITGLGATRFTASYDLNRDQLLDLVSSISTEKLEVVIHQNMPMFHMEHCVFCSVLSPGTNKTNCGRPCDSHVVQLRDRVGAEHTLQADVACRNTLYNETPQSGAEMVQELRANHVSWFRIELLDQDASSARNTARLYRGLLAGEVESQEVWKKLSADNRIGVTRGTLETKRNPLAIL